MGFDCCLGGEFAGAGAGTGSCRGGRHAALIRAMLHGFGRYSTVSCLAERSISRMRRACADSACLSPSTSGSESESESCPECLKVEDHMKEGTNKMP